MLGQTNRMLSPTITTRLYLTGDSGTRTFSSSLLSRPTYYSHHHGKLFRRKHTGEEGLRSPNPEYSNELDDCPIWWNGFMERCYHRHLDIRVHKELLGYHLPLGSNASSSCWHIIRRHPDIFFVVPFFNALLDHTVKS